MKKGSEGQLEVFHMGGSVSGQERSRKSEPSNGGELDGDNSNRE